MKARKQFAYGSEVEIQRVVRMEKVDFLEQYFRAEYDKLNAAVIDYNRKLPHAGMVGNENELALSALLRGFLPPRFGIETSGIVIDKHGHKSKQCDIVIYDLEQYPKYFRKVFPIEVVYAVIEVKTELTKAEAEDALENLKSVNMLDFRPALTPYWVTKSKEQKLESTPPCCMIFSYRSNAKNFETFAKWFPLKWIHEGIKIQNSGFEIRGLNVFSLDQGMVSLESSNEYVTRWATVASDDDRRNFSKAIAKEKVVIDPAKTLFIALERLWQRLSQHHIHPGFDIRSYMNDSMGSIRVVESGCE